MPWSRKIWPSERSTRLQLGSTRSAGEPVAVRRTVPVCLEPETEADLV